VNGALPVIMFDTLTQKMDKVLRNLRGVGKITEKNIEEAIKEVRLALLEADVNISVVKSFLEKIKERSLGQEVLQNLKPVEQFFNVVFEELVAVLGSPAKLEFTGKPPYVVLMTGLQGSGKTTTLGKIAAYLSKNGRKPFLVPADLQRPAAIAQLQTLAKAVGVPCYQTQPGQSLDAVINGALAESVSHFADIILIDTAGRLHVDDSLMEELKLCKKLITQKVDARFGNPLTLLTVDSMAGQEAMKVASRFHEVLTLDGLVLTKADGDAKGGALLSVRQVTGQPVYFVGTGEKIEDLELFDPQRLVSRLLDRGDILGLVEKARDAIDEGLAQEVGKKFFKAQFDFNDFLQQLEQMKKMGSFSSLMGMLPGGKAMAGKLNFDQLEKDLRKKKAIIQSMTVKERTRPEVLNGSRRLRIAKGSGTQVADVNRLVKEFDEMKKMFKMFKGKGQKNLLGMKRMLGM